MIVQREIVLRAVVTERLKAQLLESTQQAIANVESQQEELDRQSRRVMLELQRTDLNRAMAFRQQLDVEKRKQEDVRQALTAQLAEVQSLEMGVEVTRGTLEGFIELKVGDNLTERLGRAEILIQDDIITEIRDPAAPRDE